MNTLTPLAPPDIAVIGTFLTLVGLLGTFFYVHLTTWLRDLLALRAKFEFNQGGNTSAEEQALRECRYTLRGLYNSLPGLVSIAISGFLAFVAHKSFAILSPFLPADTLAKSLADALHVFLAIYGVLVVFLLGRGYWIGYRICRAFSG